MSREVSGMRALARDWWRQHGWFTGVITLLFAVGVWVVCTRFRHQVNPDATSYFTIAEKYAHFQLRHAVNGYWGPLLSWLLVPAVWLHIPLDLAARSVQLVAGVGLATTVYVFLRRLRTDVVLSTAAGTITMLYALQWVVLGPITPDIILTWFVVLVVLGLRAFAYHPSVQLGIILGVLGALMYFTKGFGLALFVAMTSLLMLGQLWGNVAQWRVLMRTYLPLIVTFSVLVLPFIGLLSVKYHKLTVNNAGMYDHQVFSPTQQGGNPMTLTGPFVPPNSSAISVWEDPITLMQGMPNWNPVSSWHNLNYFRNEVLGANLDGSLKFMWGSDVLLGIGLLSLIAGSVRQWRFQRECIGFLTVSVLLVFGYAVVYSEDRYLWPITILALLGACFVLSAAMKAKLVNRIQLVTLVVATGLLMVQSLYSQITHNNGAYFNGQYQLTTRLNSVMPHNVNLISDQFSSYYQCYYWRDRCFSVLNPPTNSTEGVTYYKRLKAMNVDYYLDLHGAQHTAAYDQFVAKYYTQVYDLPSQATIYRLR